MSLSTSQRVQTAHRQTAYALNINSEEFVAHYGIDHCGFLTLTFQDWPYPIPACKKLSKALPILADYFHDWIHTMGLGKNLRLHYHALVASNHNLRQGIDLSKYPLLLKLKEDNAFLPLTELERKEERAVIRKALSTNTALLQLRREIYPRLKLLGFGHQLDLSPVFSTGTAIARYMEENYLDTVRRRDPFDFRGIRLTGYKPGGHRICWPPFAWLTQRRRRRAVRIVARALGVTHYADMKYTFGPKWGYLSNLMLLDLESQHGSNPAHWPAVEIQRLAIDEKMMPLIQSFTD